MKVGMDQFCHAIRGELSEQTATDQETTLKQKRVSISANIDQIQHQAANQQILHFRFPVAQCFLPKCSVQGAEPNEVG